MSSYEMKNWEAGEYGGTLVEVPSFMIGHLLTRHHPDCAVSLALQRSAPDRDSTRRLEEAQSTVCTCGADRPINVKPLSVDRRDNRDPETVGRQIQGDPSCQSSSPSSTQPPTAPAS